MSPCSERDDPTGTAPTPWHTPNRRVMALVASTLLAAALVASACTVETTEEPTSPTSTIDEGLGDNSPTDDTDQEIPDDQGHDGGSGDDGDQGAPASGDSGIRIAREIDGDSLELEIDGAIVEVRLVGINAPELADCQGPAARDALGELLRAGNIAVSGSETDRFDRLLVELEVEGASVNEAMVRAGWALAIHGDGAAYVGAMRAAADDQVGMWSPSVPGCATVSDDVVVLDAEPDPPGRDEENLDQEYVVIANAGTEPLELGGWQLRDESTGNRFVFEDRRLGPGDELVLVTGCGQDSDREVFWCSEFPVWSNQGETVLVLAPDGAIAAHRFLE
jgi:endonuclease YncB( thermonuclease family)